MMLGEGRIITMARRRHTPEQIIRKLREADRLLAEGGEVADVARLLEISEATYHRWRAQFGGMRSDYQTEGRVTFSQVRCVAVARQACSDRRVGAGRAWGWRMPSVLGVLERR